MVGKISEDPAASVLTGVEKLAGVQSGANVVVTPAQILDYLRSQNIPRTLSVQRSGDTNNSASGSGADFDHSLTYALAANALAQGKAIRITAAFKISSGSAPPTMEIKLKAGSVVLADVIATAVASSMSNQQFAVCFLVQALDVPGVAANVECATVGNTNAAAGTNVQSSTDTPVALATNGILTFKIATQWGSVGTGTSTIALTQLIVESLN